MIFLGILLVVLVILYLPAKMVKGLIVERYCSSQAHEKIPDSEDTLVSLNTEEKNRYGEGYSKISLQMRTFIECSDQMHKRVPL
jgi:hypothetical protein